MAREFTYRRWAITRRDGGVTVMQTVDPYDPWECIAKWMFEDQMNVLDVHRIRDEDVPTDRMFRNAWGHDGKKFHVRMPEARDLVRAKMRLMREPLLKKLDVEYQIADENLDPTAKVMVASKKRILRDITDHPDIEKAKTPAALKKMWPLDLLGEMPAGIPVPDNLKKFFGVQ